ncbi:MAG TPA: sulfatase [Thermoanaerobaculia bacterium]|nr:sulfatase [Thermoanaerobaculia bacterium]
MAGCSGRSLPGGLSLRDAVAGKSFAAGGQPAGSGLWFSRPPEIISPTFEGERRTAVLTSVDPWRWTGSLPPGAELHAGVQLLPEAWQVIHGLRAWVVAKSGEEREVLDVLKTANGQTPGWLDFTADLSRWSGREVTLEFHAVLEGLPPEHRHSNLVAWGPVRVSSPEERERPDRPDRPDRPNVLFILVDTLRFDHLTPYGYRRDTSPNIARTLAKPGAVVADAYSQAPWTLPSVASYMTSRYPGEILGSDPGAYGIPEGVESLPESMAKLGYETGGFFANKVLHSGNGFARGFRTFYSPPSLPAEQGAGQPDAAELTDRVLPWVEAHRNEPFFLYVHYIDPHDPYDNPETVDGRSPFEPSPYQGRISGRHVQGVYAGKIPLDDPERDTEHLKALYDSEIHYVDRFIGRLIDSMPPDVLANTLIVLTADHGEEFREHGGWKHGFTLYEEQIHVPLLVRWDGRIPAGSRLPGTVRLLDLVPTLVGAAGGKASPAWEGVSLLPALRGTAPLPRLAAFAQHMMIGPLRAAAVLGRRKLILFNPRTPYTPADPLQAHLWTQDLGRLHRVELYDLGRDAKEKNDLAAASPGLVNQPIDQLQPVIHRQLDRQMPGLRVLASGFPAGSRIAGSIVLGRPPTRWVSYFLAEDDRVEVAGNRVSFDLGGETLEKGFLLEGDLAGVKSVEARADGRPLPAGQILASQILAGRAGATAVSGARGPALRLWLPDARRAPSRDATVNPETEQSLRALGYVQ